MLTHEEQMRKLLLKLQLDCEHMKNESLANFEGEEERGWCGVVWDNILCWNRTRPGTVARLPCPAYIPLFSTTEYAERVCTENGTWWVSPKHNSSWTNFSKCVPPPVDISTHAKLADILIRLYTVGYSISLVSLIVAVVIMLYWRRLHCKSNTLHINLFIAFILRASISFMKDRLFVNGLGLPGDVREGNKGLVFIEEGNHWECRTLFVLLMFTISASQTWMLMEGLYLYLLVHKTMATERLGVTPYIFLGWVLPWSFLIPWIVVKSFFENSYCWNFQENPTFFWILKGPWTAIVVINFFFFLDIIRVLMTRVRDSQRHVGRSQYRKFGKFILVLIPLFGIMYIVLNVAFPSEVQGRGYNVVYLYIEMGYNSFQTVKKSHRKAVGDIIIMWIHPGFIVLFLNEDVHSELRRSWQRQKSRRYNSNIMRRSNAQNSWHRTSRSSGTSPPAAPNDADTCRSKLNNQQTTKTSHIRRSLSVCSTYMSTSCAPANGDGSRTITLIKFGDKSLRHSFRENGLKNSTLL